MRNHVSGRRARALFHRSACALLMLSASGAIAQAVPADTAGVGSPFELAFWQSVAGSNDAAQYSAYIARYPNGTFATLARAKIAALGPQQAPAPVATPPSAPAPMSAATPPAPAPATPTEAAAAIAATPAAMPAEQAASPSGVRPYSAPAAVRAALPIRPTLAQVDPIQLPAGFCSATSRDEFYTKVFRPAADIAADNNQRANAYLAAVQVQYDRYNKTDDVTGINITAQEAAAYRDTAAAAFHLSTDFGAKYDALMKLPVNGCH